MKQYLLSELQNKLRLLIRDYAHFWNKLTPEIIDEYIN